MTKPSRHIPFYLQMVDLLRNAIALLDDQGREEALQFITSQQNADGGFQDRGGRSDLYYSLFGGMMLRAESPLNPPEGDFDETRAISSVSLKRLGEFIGKQKGEFIPGFIEQCCLILLQKELRIKRFSRFKSLLSLARSFMKEKDSINLSYRSFVLFLTLDTVLPFPGILKLASKKMFAKTTVDQHSPCSEIAAKVFLQKMMNQKGLKEQELLKSFACDSGGFKAFQHLQQADMLSTAVALFALNYANHDLRLLKPACLDFIQSNFSVGAFLSGDGDPTTDVEYTFYGLLALGVLGK
jgi:prenyltransferase beta subunit